MASFASPRFRRFARVAAGGAEPFRPTFMPFARALAGIAAALFVAGASSAAESVYRDVKSISIEVQGKAAPGTDAEVCRPFRLSPAFVAWLLRNAPEVDRRYYAHELDYAPCTVEGRVILRNGLTGVWEIEMSGRARVAFDDEHVLLLHCRRCKAPFVR
jgi:hypothetical protein